MCLIVFSWAPGTAQPLLLLANRDEVHTRATAPLAQWADAPLVHAGRDLQAGGSWLGIAPQQRFAALTNIRALEPQAPCSRGGLISDYLAGQLAPAQYLHALSRQLDDFNGFNLLLGDRRQLWFLNSAAGRAKQLDAGIYALSNASLDTPWPKLVRVRTLFSQALQQSDAQLLQLMRDERRAEDAFLPNTGVGLVMERMLSSIFIRGESYGTRTTSLMRMTQKELGLLEQNYAASGCQEGELRRVTLKA